MDHGCTAHCSDFNALLCEMPTAEEFQCLGLGSARCDTILISEKVNLTRIFFSQMSLKPCCGRAPTLLAAAMMAAAASHAVRIHRFYRIQ